MVRPFGCAQGRQAHHERDLFRPSWDERAPPTTILPSGITVVSVDTWFSRLAEAA